jgi:MFS transporter, UMF1 family
MFKLKNLSKKERAWVLYDIANSAFILTVVTVLFPLYHIFIASDGGNDTTAGNQAALNFKYITAGLALLIALLSPIFTSLADYKGNKKKFFKIFLWIGLAGSLLLAVPWSEIFPGIGALAQWLILIVLFFFTVGGYNLTNVIYDSFIVDVTSEDRYDEVSSLGYGWGYIGSMVPFFIAIIPFALVTFNIIPDTFYVYTMSFAFIIVFAWWLIYSLPLIKDVDQTYVLADEEQPLKKSLLRLVGTFKDVRKYKNIFIFLMAYLLYIDVVNTVIRLATTIGAQLGVGDASLLGIVIMVQFIAFPFAIIFGKLTRKFGQKKMIFFGIFLYMIAIFMTTLIENYGVMFMWYVGVIIGMGQGGIQAVSRSFFASMLPKEKSNEFFGFFSVFGKFAGVFSPFLLAILETAYGISAALNVLYLPLIVSGILLIFVKKEIKEEVPIAL